MKPVIEKKSIPIASAWYLRTWRNFCMDIPQVHDRLEMMYVLSGSCMMSVKSEHHSMKKGDFLFLDSKVPHTLVTDTDIDCRMLNVEYEMIDTFSGFPGIDEQAAAVPELEELWKHRPFYLFMKDAGDVGSLLRSLVLELDRGTDPANWLVQSLFASMHMRIARLWAESERFRIDTGEHYVAEALRFLRDHYDQDIRVADIAGFVCVHPAHLQRIFRRSQGITLIDCLNRYRMEQAKMLLITTDLSITDLCGYVGMNNRQHFSSVFREHMGISPAEFRKRSIHLKYADK